MDSFNDMKSGSEQGGRVRAAETFTLSSEIVDESATRGPAELFPLARERAEQEWFSSGESGEREGRKRVWPVSTCCCVRHTRSPL